MTLPEAPSALGELPEAAREILDEFGSRFGVRIVLRTVTDGASRVRLYPPHEPPHEPGASEAAADGVVVVRRSLAPKDGPELELELQGPGPEVDVERVAAVLGPTLERVLDFAHEVRFFTFELAERYEEINLLYSISETLGSILHLTDAAQVILEEVCDVLRARRGSLWVHDAEAGVLRLTAAVGEEGLEGPIDTSDPEAVTARAFREGRPFITSRDQGGTLHGVDVREQVESFLSVPIRYTPPAEDVRTVGVVNLIGRRHGSRFTASDQKLLSAIATQVGAALENNRLIEESLAQERLAQEMKLAHNLQMKLLPSAERFEGAQVAARVQPAESVGGDFYQLLQLSESRAGVMIGDVSGHGFSAALIMALSMSAATIYAAEFGSPTKVLRHIGEALQGELSNTEMYLTLFYGVVDPGRRRLTYANAGHPHAFCVRRDGSSERLGAIDPPIGFTDEVRYGEHSIDFDRGDTLFLFTDGLAEPLTVRGGDRGEARLLESLSQRCEESLDCVIDALFDLEVQEDAVAPPDDRTALLLRV